VVHDVIVHIANEQPIMADLLALPLSSDTNLICTNVRTMNGKKPVFVSFQDSTFAFPLIHIRFIEIPRAQMEASETEEAVSRPMPPAEGEYQESPLSRLTLVTGEGEQPQEFGLKLPEVSAEEPAREPVEEDLWPDELRRRADMAGLDGDLLKRIRDA
jgi:hypothetical protein